MEDEDKKDMNFNIYYLNFSKVYEISMMINNVIVSGIQREKVDENETFKRTNASLTAYLGNIKSVIGAAQGEKSVKSSKLIESLDVITTKSILLREIISKCKNINEFTNCKEGDLVKIDKLRLSILDEDNLKGARLLRKNALKGLSIQNAEMSFDLNNLFSSALQDASYILKGVLDGKKESEVVILKIPLEIEDEFENKYNVYDLLIGRLSVIGVYKGTVDVDFIKTNTIDFTNLGAQQPVTDGKVIQSSTKQNIPVQNSSTQLMDKGTTLHFIDIIALIQDIKFEPPNEEIIIQSQSIFKRFWNFIRLGGRDK